MRRESVHVILVPETEPSKMCSDYKAWHPGVEAGRLFVDARRVVARDKRGRFNDAATWRAFVRKRLFDKRVGARCEVDPRRVDSLIEQSSPVLVPTYLVTWGEAMSRVRVLANDHGCRNLGRAAMEVAELAYGPEGDRLDKFVAKKVIFVE